MTPLFWIIVILVAAEFVLGRYLTNLNRRTWSDRVPEELKGYYDEEKYARAQAYERDRTALGIVSGYFSLFLLLLMLFFQGFAWLNGWVSSLTDSPVLQTLFFFGALFLASDVVSTPFSIYGIFHIEDKYGFNKMTWKTYFTDKLKSWMLGIVLGGGILGLITWFYYSAGDLFWLYAWAAVTVVSLFTATFYTTLIVPLFNKLTPLAEGPLRDRIKSFADKVAFPLKNIFIIDGSKRSTKANAYFSGLGERKSIVLFDTLIEDHSEEELVAILAHEVGHYKKKHIQKGMVISVLHTGFLLFLVGVFVGSAPLSGALGVESPNFHIGILAFTILYSPISMFTGVLMNIFSRKNEYEADNFAREYFGAEFLISALKKLSVKHLSNLQPHPLYVFFHYSHPPLLDRISNLKS
jgi:STE24 endopeptidase